MSTHVYMYLVANLKVSVAQTAEVRGSERGGEGMERKERGREGGREEGRKRG